MYYCHLVSQFVRLLTYVPHVLSICLPSWPPGWTGQIPKLYPYGIILTFIHSLSMKIFIEINFRSHFKNIFSPLSNHHRLGSLFRISTYILWFPFAGIHVILSLWFALKFGKAWIRDGLGGIFEAVADLISIFLWRLQNYVIQGGLI